MIPFDYVVEQLAGASRYSTDRLSEMQNDHPAGKAALSVIISAVDALRDRVLKQGRLKRDDAEAIDELGKTVLSQMNKCRVADEHVKFVADWIRGIPIELHAELSGPKGEPRFPE